MPTLRTSQLNVALAGHRDAPVGFVKIARTSVLLDVRRMIDEEVRFAAPSLVGRTRAPLLQLLLECLLHSWLRPCPCALCPWLL